MNCYLHTDRAAIAYCRSCGRPLCEECQRSAQGTIFCEEHLPVEEPVQPAAPTTYQPGASSPGLAFVLGLIPGVGAIYNGQYVKGLIHVIIFGMLISIVNSGGLGDFGPLFGLLATVWYFYMPFEAFHTARKRQRGEPVDEFSSLVALRSGRGTGGPVVIIVVGVIFLLNTLGILRIGQILKYWPVCLIALGGYMLYNRLTGSSAVASQTEEAEHGR